MAHVLEILGWEPMREHMTVGVLGTLGLFPPGKRKKKLGRILGRGEPHLMSGAVNKWSHDARSQDGSAQSLRVKRNNARARARTV